MSKTKNHGRKQSSENNITSDDQATVVEQSELNVSTTRSNTRMTRSQARLLGIEVCEMASKRKLQSDEVKQIVPKRRKLNEPKVMESSPLSPNTTKPVVMKTQLSALPVESVLEPVISTVQPNIVESTSASPAAGPSTIPIQSLEVAVIDFKIDEIVWAKIKGHAHWPARVKSFPSQRMAEVVWFNDYRRTKLYKTQLYKFLANFEKFAARFDDTVGLKTAAQEAMMLYGSNLNINMF